MENYDNNNDKNIIEQLEVIRSTPARDPQTAADGETAFIEELDSMYTVSQNPGAFLFSGTWVTQFFNYKEKLQMLSHFQRAAIAGLLALAVIVFGGFGIGKAARATVPGDALYPFKIRIEQAELVFSSRASGHVELYLEFAEHRIEEIEEIAEAGNFSEIGALVEEMETYLEKAGMEALAAAQGNPELGEELADEVEETASELAEQLEEILDDLPENLAEDIRSNSLLLQTSGDDQDTEGDGVVDEEIEEEDTDDVDDEETEDIDDEDVEDIDDEDTQDVDELDDEINDEDSEANDVEDKDDDEESQDIDEVDDEVDDQDSTDVDDDNDEVDDENQQDVDEDDSEDIDDGDSEETDDEDTEEVDDDEDEADTEDLEDTESDDEED